MKKFVLSCLAAVLILTLSARTAHAAFSLQIAQVGPSVVLSGSGSINLTGLTLSNTNTAISGINPLRAVVQLGSASRASTSFYNGASGPGSFGTNNGSYEPADSGTGSAAGVGNFSGLIQIRVPAGYVSGTALSGTATFNNATFASLGYTPGTYVYTWGTGANADSLTITSVVPEPSTWAMLGLGSVGAGVVAMRRRRAA